MGNMLLEVFGNCEGAISVFFIFFNEFRLIILFIDRFRLKYQIPNEIVQPKPIDPASMH